MAYDREMIAQTLKVVRHCAVLGLEVEAISEDSLTLKLPYSNAIIGNPETGVIHGGALTTLMDTACGFVIPLVVGRLDICPTLDLRIDYMTAAEPGKPVFGRASVYRHTDNVIFCRGVAFQQPGETIIAHCVATFMRLAPESLEQQP